jgi:hypothetical protein
MEHGIMFDPPTVAAAEAEATKLSADSVGKGEEHAAPRPRSGDTPRQSMAELTSSQIAIEIYRRLGWSR